MTTENTLFPQPTKTAWTTLWPFGLATFAFAADRWSKIWVGDFLAENGDTVINSWLTLREVYNRGVAFGWFQGIGPLVGWLSIAVVIGFVVYLWRLPHYFKLTRFSLGMIIGGALGNLVDRVTAGAVLDFFETPFRPGIFNVADIFINVGMVILLFGSFLEKEKEKGDLGLEIGGEASIQSPQGRPEYGQSSPQPKQNG